MTVAEQELRKDWPGAILIKEPEGWAIYGGIENVLEAAAMLATGHATPDDAWESALEYYKDMCNEETKP